MTSSAPERPRLSPEEAGIAFGLFLLVVARLLTAAAKRVGGTRVASRVEEDRHTEHEYALYTAASLEESLHRFETHFGLSSSEFVELYRRDEVHERVSRHAANVWVGIEAELSRLREHAADPDELFKAAIAS